MLMSRILRFHKSLICILLIFLSGTIAAFSLSAQEEKPSLAILDVTPVNVEISKTTIVYGYIVDKVHKTGTYTIVERSEIDKALKEIEFSLSSVVA